MRRLPELGRRYGRSQGRPGPPDYIGVGAEGSGTNWWHSLLLAHPEIRAPRERALDFFGTFCDREMQPADISRYNQHFRRRDGAIGGEWTDRYMADGWVPPLLRRVAPDARLLVMLRDPIECYRASYAERSAYRVPGDRLSMTDAADRRNYASQLARLQRFFDPDRILVLQYERCRADPLGQYRRTLRFLGVRDDFVPWRLRAASGRAQALAVAGVRRLPLAEPVRRRALARLTGPAAPAADSAALWPDLEAALLTTFSPEVERLLELVPELELSLWPGFTRTAAPPALAQPT
jgi:hypothetical protein